LPIVDISNTSWLALTDALVFAAAGLGLLAIRRLRPVSAPDLPTAFQILERSIEKYAPGVPLGYSWGEAFEWLRGKGVDADWVKVKARLAEYERFRYGGKSLPLGGEEDVLSLAHELRRSIIGK
jgi:hypothetical protein